MNSDKYRDVLQTPEEKQMDLLIKFRFGFPNVDTPDRTCDGSLVYYINDASAFGDYPQIIQWTKRVLTAPDVDVFKEFIKEKQFSVGTLITTKRVCKTASNRSILGNQVTIWDGAKLKKLFNLTKNLGLDKAAETWDKTRNWESFNSRDV